MSRNGHESPGDCTGTAHRQASGSIWDFWNDEERRLHFSLVQQLFGSSKFSPAYERHLKQRAERRLAQRNATSARRRAAKLRRTPAWADLAAIQALYIEAAIKTAETGMEHHVDHIYPLQGRLVSGLHVHTNLQVLPGVENMRKNNRYEP